MGKKKAFIDKKKAVTYNLIYRSTEDTDVPPERLLVETDKGVGIGKPDADAAAAQQAAHAASGRRFPPGHPLAWLEEESLAEGGDVPDARRRELLQLGFPDDGYDYLRHMRTLGQGAASLEGMQAQAQGGAAGAGAAASGGEGAGRLEDGADAGPSVFVPAPGAEAPQEDVQLFDASRLTLMQPVEREEEAEGMMGGVTAFSRQRREARGAAQRDLAEVEELMRQMEEEEGEGEGLDGEGGLGDLLDDFVVTATEMPADRTAAPAGREAGSDADVSADEESDSMYSDVGSSGSDSEEGKGRSRGGGSRGGVPARPGSIASTYWREERHDRKNLLSVIDERFEHMALEYDEDEIGEMEEQEGEIQGPATLDQFSGILEEFHASHTQSQRAYENNLPYDAPGYRSAISKNLEEAGLSDEDGAVAIAKAHEALRRAEEAEHSDGEGGGDRQVVWVEDGAAARREAWDCESVLSLRSNLDNHPGKIGEPGRGRKGGVGNGTAAKAVAQHMVKLGRYGIPMGVLPGKPTAAALRRLDEAAAVAVDGGGGSGSDGSVSEGGFGTCASHAAAFVRPKGESAEEKRARKAAVKEAKREARATKKALKTMYKEETSKAQRRAATAQVQAALKLP